MKPQTRAAIAVALLLLAACDAAPDAAAPAAGNILLPGLADSQASLQTLRVRTAGNVDAVTLVRREGAWRIVERADWPADPALVANLLQALGQLRGAEAKTADPTLYPRLGVEPVASPDAMGAELHLDAPGVSRRLIVGKESPQATGSFVRIGDEPGTWLADRVLVAPHDADAWLDRRVVDLPLARVAEVAVAPVGSPPFRVLHAADGYAVVTGALTMPAAVEPGEALAGVLGPLELDAVARDDASPPERELRVIGDDGFVVSVAAWRRDGKVWLRVHGDVDVARAQAWASQSATTPTLAQLRARAAALDARCSGYMFRVPDLVASVLMTGRASLLVETR